MIVPVPDDIPAADRLGRVHFVGIAGAGLSAIARVMAATGVRVSGSDAHSSPTLESLGPLGIETHVGHDGANVADADLVVVSTAVPEDNVEVVEARRRGLPVWPRSAAMQSLMVGRDSVVVTGTHGKTTTTAMLVTALHAAGADPSYTVGSVLLSTGVNAGVGRDQAFVAEGDESDAAILAYTPAGIVVTNVDVDHLDFFGTAAAYAAMFDDFLRRLRPGGFVVCGVDDPGGRRLAAGARAAGLRTVTVGHGHDTDIRLVPRSGSEAETGEVNAAVAVVQGGSESGTLRLRTPGAAYALDAGLALAAGQEMGHPFERLISGLEEYRGTGRRMEFKGEAAGVRVYDSYAHHPSELRADLLAARVLAAGSRLVVCFQPHLYSRTLAFAEQMGEALGLADAVVVLDVYPAREQPIAGVSGELVARAVPLDPGAVSYVPAVRDAARALAALAQEGDLVLTLGAGDVTAVGPQLLQTLSTRIVEEAP